MTGAPRVPLEIRYERHIERGPTPDDCWIWHGNRNQAGYGQFRIGRTGNGPVISVHRWAYEYFVGPIPDGMWVCHHCDNPRCSNPKHLYAGSPVENADDCTVRGRRALKKGDKRPFMNRLCKLTDDAVRAIRVDERDKLTVALAHGVSEVHVASIRKRKRKAHVPDDPVMTAAEAAQRWPPSPPVRRSRMKPR